MKLTVEAQSLRPGDIMPNGEKIKWVIADYILQGKTEIAVEPGRAMFLDNKAPVTVERTVVIGV